jgi:hypothetical protein
MLRATIVFTMNSPNRLWLPKKQWLLTIRKAIAVYARRYTQNEFLFVKTDSAYREMKATTKSESSEKTFGRMDSLLFSSKDSCLRMYHDPIIWNEKQQLLGEEINVYMNDSTIDWAHIINQALTVEQKDSIHYNQISGKEIKAYFQGGEARKIDVIGNVLVIYYPEEKDSTMIGMNTSETSLLNLHLMNRKMEKMVMSPKSNGTLYPMDQIPVDKMKLPTFVWFDYIRPQNKEDIFNWRGKKSGETLRKTTRKPVTSPKRELINELIWDVRIRNRVVSNHQYIYVDERKRN